ncbi:glycerol-3-phosphate phosphatase-like [Osmia bicornis bicornis]|uniref:glycerol-3-phosphate phosphatase-like n=1 Tax=Osmia bicornis bicornis TaxID=1437191 RepID=UPI0010F49662|nr:glycerol-3-phosphate phosphatase-like [Osmia bicornis bicornis]XP_029046012.1 glycerol-3-phosphate phosphatase-like [Osmia bicornis bicornis]XP_029046013.1 glycerol-3-phosphate phosphatase-like [Osmia bicornis bicornis]XP_029046014.1 glycerol-3-phosphate phosphatase-like [Osmia bicornis bicornis]
MAAIDFNTLNDENVTKFFHSFDTVLTDCDGVLWMYMNPLPNAAEVMNAFRSLGKRVFYVTNNSTKTREEFVNKCKILNFKVSKEEILCTANLSACYLQDLGFNKKVYIIGSEAIGKELEEVGISHIGVGPDPVNKNGPYTTFIKDPDVGAVIVGFDEHFNYPKMVKAASYLSDPDVHFIATNTDERFPVANNVVIPGTGSLVRCIESCAERKAVVMGKPEPYLADVLMKRFQVDPKRTLMIGDRHNTDILLGRRCGFKTLLVLTGITSLEDVNRWKQSECSEEKDFIPDYYIESIGDLLPHLEKFKNKSAM